MTISNETVLVTHVANGVTRDWPWAFPIPDTDFLVVKKVNLDDYTSVVVDPSEYEITENGDGTGSIEYPLAGAALDAPYGVILKRELPLAQTLAASKSQLGSLATGLNTQLDKIVMMAQQLAATMDRAVLLREGDPSGPMIVTDAYEPAYADLTDIAALTPAEDDILQRKAGAWTSQAPSSLALISTGSTEPRTLADRFGDVCNVLDYGAVGDNSTDNLVAFEAAIDAALARSLGGVVYVPSGRYHLSAKITRALAPNKMLSIVGDGQDLTELVWTVADGGLDFTFQPSGWWLRVPLKPGSGQRVTGLSLITTVSDGGTALHIDGQALAGRPAPSIILSDVAVRGGADGGGGDWTVAFDMEEVSSVSYDAIRITGQNQGDTMTGVLIRSTSEHDIALHKFVNCQWNFCDNAIEAGSYVEGIHVVNSTMVVVNKGIEWVCGAESQFALVNSHISARVTAIDLVGVYDSQITGNLVLGAGANAVSLTDCGYNTITGNIFRSNGAVGTMGVQVQRVAGWNSSWRNLITANFFFDYDVGIYVDTGVTGVSGVGNQFNSCATDVTDIDGTNVFLDAVGSTMRLTGNLATGLPVTKTADFTLAAQENDVINNKSGSACVVTLPAASSFPGRRVRFKTIQAQALNSASANVVPLAGGSAGTAILTGTAGRWAELLSDGSNWVVIAGS